MSEFIGAFTVYVCFGLMAYVVIRQIKRNLTSKRKAKQKAYTAKFVIGDLVRIKGESHEWAIVQKLDDKRVLLDYNDEGNDYEALLVAQEKDLELA